MLETPCTVASLVYAGYRRKHTEAAGTELRMFSGSPNADLGGLVPCERAFGEREIRVLAGQQFLAHGYTSCPPLLGFGKSALILVDLRQELLAIGNVWVLWAALLCQNIKCLTADSLSFLVVRTLAENLRQAIEVPAQCRMIRGEPAGADVDGLTQGFLFLGMLFLSA